jgi:hypothetical protein
VVKGTVVAAVMGTAAAMEVAAVVETVAAMEVAAVAAVAVVGTAAAMAPVAVGAAEAITLVEVEVATAEVLTVEDRTNQVRIAMAKVRAEPMRTLEVAVIGAA